MVAQITSDNVIQFFKGTFFNGMNTISRIHTLLPDSILFGSLLLYFLTQNSTFGVFAIFVFETEITHKLISWVTSQAVGPSSRPSNIECSAGFKTPQFAAERVFSHDQYPSYGVFSVTAMATYLMMATKEFSDTMNAMGAEWAMRPAVAYSFIGVFLFAFILSTRFRCQVGFAEIAIAVIFALITGLLFFYINKSIFGPESMNFLGLPYLVSKDSQGSPIYICTQEPSN